MKCLNVLVILVTFSFRLILAKPAPTLPLQFSATVEITAHRVDKESTYPLHHRTLKVAYDQPNGRFKAQEDDKDRSTIRRYDEGVEYQLIDMTKDPEEEITYACMASKLKSKMPAPEWPSKAVYEGTEQVNGVECDRWREDFGSVEIDVYVNTKTGVPVRVQLETIEQTEPVRLSTPDITYDWTEFTAGEPKHEFADGELSPRYVFDLPEEIQDPETACQWQPNNIGFPYLHFFHHYYRV